MMPEGEREKPPIRVAGGIGLRHFFDSINLPGAALTTDGKVLFTSQRLVEMLKTSRDELEGSPFEGFVAPQERTRFQRLMGECAAARTSSGEIVLRRSDKESLFAHVALRQLRRPFPDVLLLLCLDTTHHHERAERLRRERAELEARVEERTAELAAANSALQAANRTLAAQHAVLQRALQQSPDALIVVDAEGRIVLANSAARQFGDLDPSGVALETAQPRSGYLYEADGRPIGPDEVSIVKALRGEACLGREVRVVHPNQGGRIFLVSAMPLFDEAKQIVGAISTAAHVTHLRGADESLAVSLEENALLLREMRHRFRNSLAFLASLLGLQSDSVTSEEAREALEESRRRVYSMARLQDQLHHGRSGGPVRMARFLDDLIAALAQSYGHHAIQLFVEAEGVLLDPERANSVGLIVNELVTNAFKHAFPDGSGGQIAVSLEDGGEDYRLRVRDTGVGLLSDRHPEQSSSFGLRLVNLLVRRLAGTLSLDATHGSCFTITFPLKPKE